MQRILPILALLPLATPSLFAQELAFQPKEQQSWLRTHQTQVNLEFDSIQTTINGQVSEATGMDIQLKASNTVQVQDQIIAWEPDGKRIFERDYMQVTREIQAPISLTLGEQKVESNLHAFAEGALQGERFRFEWDAEVGDWKRFFVEDLEDEDLAEPRPVPSLNPHFDMECLLPKPGTKVGAKWEVDATAFLNGLMAKHGMQWHFQESTDKDLPLWLGSLSQQPELSSLWQNFEKAKVVCELKPRRKAGGLNLYEIHVQATINGDCDLSEWTMDSLARQSRGEIDALVQHAFQSTVLTGSGVYLWNTDRRVMHSFRFVGDAQFARTQEILIGEGEEAMEIGVESDGRFELDVRSRARH